MIITHATLFVPPTTTHPLPKQMHFIIILYVRRPSYNHYSQTETSGSLQGRWCSRRTLERPLTSVLCVLHACPTCRTSSTSSVRRWGHPPLGSGGYCWTWLRRGVWCRSIHTIPKDDYFCFSKENFFSKVIFRQVWLLMERFLCIVQYWEVYLSF